ncbi:MAG: hypothetical protein M1827_001100 [Pycnora praestabilis]|nr:MAG: hypothetical protein M1827_001100 [Pycnora praestabilis]
MATRTTRSSAAKEAAFLTNSDKENAPQQTFSPPATPSLKRKAATTEKAAKTKDAPKAASKATLKMAPKTSSKSASKAKKAVEQSEPVTPASSQKRKRTAPVKEKESIDELPHNLGKIVPRTIEEVKDEIKDEPEPEPSPKKRTPRAKKKVDGESKQGLKDAEKVVTQIAQGEGLVDESPIKKAKKAKANSYGLTPGETPYPDWPHPTPEECQEVNDLLEKVHGRVKAPDTIPTPSTTVSGCGEVPSILDALIRTLLSAATTGLNSSRAFKGLVDKFGLLKEGIGKGSVDWDAVRRADIENVFDAIKEGGLANVKSKRIKEILSMVYEENKARRDALVKAKEIDHVEGPRGAENENEGQKEAEIIRADENVLSLDHLHALGTEEAMSTLTKYPGIGVKTASCVMLFCMQRPSFAVDTHVFRLCKWLDWVPDKSTRDKTYSHCDVRIPDNLKYPLHQLFIKHGKTCPRCRAATSENSANWAQGCPIDHLITRTGKRKGNLSAVKGTKGKAKKGKIIDDTEDEDDVDIEEDEEDEDEGAASEEDYKD